MQIQPKEKLASLDPDFQETLTRIAGKLPFTLYITEGVPTSKEGSHVRESEHLEGLEVDVRVKGGWERYMVTKAALEEGIKRLGVYNAHVHIGASKTLPSPVVWQGQSK
jgi:hypothetical protein